MFLPVIEIGILTCLPFFVFMRRRHVHADVHPVYFTSMERAPCIIILVGDTQRGPDILEEPLAELPGPALIHGGVGLSEILLARGLLGVYFLLEVGCQRNKLDLMIWDRLVPHACVFVISVEAVDARYSVVHHRPTACFPRSESRQ